MAIDIQSILTGMTISGLGGAALGYLLKKIIKFLIAIFTAITALGIIIATAIEYYYPGIINWAALMNVINWATLGNELGSGLASSTTNLTSSVTYALSLLQTLGTWIPILGTGGIAFAYTFHKA